MLSSADLAVTNTFAPLDQLPDVSEISAPKRITNLLIPSLETAEIPEALKARSGQLFPSVVLIDETLISVANAVAETASKSPAARAVFEAGLEAVTPYA